MPACSVLLRHMGDAEDPFMDCAAPPALAPSIPPPPQDLIRSLILAFSAWGRSSSAESAATTYGGGSGGACHGTKAASLMRSAGLSPPP